MKIIIDNYNKFPIKVECESCGSVIELENEDDLRDDVHYEVYWVCPLCKNENYIENF